MVDKKNWYVWQAFWNETFFVQRPSKKRDSDAVCNQFPRPLSGCIQRRKTIRRTITTQRREMSTRTFLTDKLFAFLCSYDTPTGISDFYPRLQSIPVIDLNNWMWTCVTSEDWIKFSKPAISDNKCYFLWTISQPKSPTLLKLKMSFGWTLIVELWVGRFSGAEKNFEFFATNSATETRRLINFALEHALSIETRERHHL